MSVRKTLHLAPTGLQRLISWLCFGLAGFYLYRHVALLLLHGGPRGDLDILLLAGRRFTEGQPIYQILEGSEHTKPPFLSPFLALLATLPVWLTHALSDLLLLVLPFVSLTWWSRMTDRPLRHIPAAAAIGILGPLWFTESVYGQYNLLSLAASLGAVLLLQKSGSRFRPMVAGALFWGTLILKPTQLLFFPLFIHTIFFEKMEDRHRSLIRFLSGIAWGTFISVAAYQLFKPFPAILIDLSEWSSFLKLSQAKHLLRPDNFGIPTLLARWGGHSPDSFGFTLIGLLVALIAILFGRSLEVAFLSTTLITLVFSPMSWRQNYVMLLPLAYESARRVPEKKLSAGIALVALMILARFSEHWAGPALANLWGLYGGPLICALVAWGAGTIAGRHGREST